MKVLPVPEGWQELEAHLADVHEVDWAADLDHDRAKALHKYLHRDDVEAISSGHTHDEPLP